MHVCVKPSHLCTESLLGEPFFLAILEFNSSSFFIELFCSKHFNEVNNQGSPSGSWLFSIAVKHGTLTHTDLHISVEADGGHKDSVQVLKGSWAMLFLIDVEGQCAFSQIQQDTHSRALSDASLCPTHTHTHKTSQFCYVYVP